MEKIIINPHNCSREEYGELKKYLNEQSWDWDTESKTSKQEVQAKILYNTNFTI
jgi:GrpB-like predicted nucleotidyltransferase (UPF0157 family)